jgi:hypothetical protein
MIVSFVMRKIGNYWYENLQAIQNNVLFDFKKTSRGAGWVCRKAIVNLRDA